MKKTLIALMATSGMAMAVTLDDATFSQAGNTGYNTQSGNFTVALTLDVAELRTLLEKNQTITSWGTDIICYACNGSQTGVTVNGGSQNNKINTSSLYARWGTDIAWNPNGGTDVVWNGSTNLSDLNGNAAGTGWDDVAFAGLVYSFGSTSGTTVSFTLIGKDGNTIVDSIVTAGGLKSSGAGAAALTFDDSVVSSYYFNEYKGASTDDMKNLAQLAATTAPIPEPTTATLSLLALAGLAARRRRK